MTESAERFEGVIADTVGESAPWWPPDAAPPAGAPNVVVVVLDDLGFGHLGCYGSALATPNIDRLAHGGLRYTNFHVTPLCSPTRASLLTGRDHHEVGMRAIANFDTGFPNMRGEMSRRAATMAEVLRDAGYATFALGKWHLCRPEATSAAGPFDQWPCGRGFDRFYGFLEGETDQFRPELVCDNHPVDPPARPEDGYHLSEDLVDRAIEMITDSRSVRPDRPFFAYLAFGATHAPHQAPASFLTRYRGRFDQGWDVARTECFARQQELGLLPESTELAPLNPGVARWDDLSANERAFAARLQEAFAAFLEHTDVQIGRLVDTLRRLEILDDTLLLLLSDNGASQEGGPSGVMHEMKSFNLLAEDPDEAVARLDEIGGPRSHTNYPWGWAQAGNTPFRWYKQNTHAGGVHVPLIVHWPARIADAGGLRDQFHYVTDVAPTVYEAASIEAPDVFRGVPQIPLRGTSLLYSAADAAAPPRRRAQHFEMMGHRALHLDGWKAVTRHRAGTSYDEDDWELYHVEHDRSECRNVGSREPDRLASMIERWWEEARAHDVLPLDDRTVELFGARFRDGSPHRADRRYRYHPPLSALPVGAAAAIGGRSWDLDAVLTCPGGAQGVIYSLGTANSGVALFVQDGRLVFDYNCFGDHRVVESEGKVPEGRAVAGVRFRRQGRSGSVTLTLDGVECARLEIPLVMGMISSVGAGVGRGHGTPVSDRYEGEYPFTGTIEVVEIRLVSRSEAAREGEANARAEAADVAAVEERAGFGRQ